MFKKIILIIGFFMSNIGFAAEWKLISFDNQSNISATYLDVSNYNYNRVKNTSNLWIQTIFLNDKDQDLGGYNRSIAFYKIDCQEKKIQLLTSTIYNASTGQNKSFEENNKSSYIIPGTKGEILWFVACGTKGKGFYIPKAEISDILTPREKSKLMPE